MLSLPAQDPLAVAVTSAIRAGDLDGLGRLLAGHPGLAGARIVRHGEAAGERSLLHIAVDWPGHRPRTAEVIRTLVAAGADPGARFGGSHEETPLHWAASNDDVPALDALVEAGADIEARARCSAAALHWPTRPASASGARRAASWTLGPAPPCGTRPPSDCSALYGSSSPRGRIPRRSPKPSGARATGADCPRPDTCCLKERTSTGSATAPLPPSTLP